MRNASKNTIKRVMRKALFDQTQKGGYFYPSYGDEPGLRGAYFRFNEIGAQIYRMSKGKICNRGLVVVGKYLKTPPKT